MLGRLIHLLRCIEVRQAKKMELSWESERACGERVYMMERVTDYDENVYVEWIKLLNVKMYSFTVFTILHSEMIHNCYPNGKEPNCRKTIRTAEYPQYRESSQTHTAVVGKIQIAEQELPTAGQPGVPTKGRLSPRVWHICNWQRLRSTKER